MAHVGMHIGTCSERLHTLALFDEAIEFLHLGKRSLGDVGLSISVEFFTVFCKNGADLFSQSLDIFGASKKIEQHLRAAVSMIGVREVSGIILTFVSVAVVV